MGFAPIWAMDSAQPKTTTATHLPKQGRPTVRRFQRGIARLAGRLRSATQRTPPPKHFCVRLGAGGEMVSFAPGANVVFATRMHIFCATGPAPAGKGDVWRIWSAGWRPPSNIRATETCTSIRKRRRSPSSLCSLRPPKCCAPRAQRDGDGPHQHGQEFGVRHLQLRAWPALGCWAPPRYWLPTLWAPGPPRPT